MPPQPEFQSTEPEHTRWGERLRERTQPLQPNDAQYGWAHAILCEALAKPYEQIAELIDPPEPYPPWGPLFDINVCPGWALPFLAQAVGIRLPAGIDEAAARLLILETAGHNVGKVSAIKAALQATLRKPTGLLYDDVIAADSPVSHWKLGELEGTIAAGAIPGAYNGSNTPNLVPNPDFTSGVPPWAGDHGNWRTNAGAVLTQINGGPLGLTKALQVVTPDTTATDQKIFFGPDNAEVNVEAKTYMVSVYLKGAVNGEKVHLCVGDGTVGGLSGPNLVLTTNWVRYSVKWTPTKAGKTGVAVRTYGTTASQTFFVGAFAVTEGDTLQQWSPGQGLTLGQPGVVVAEKDTAVTLNFGYIQVPDDPALRFTDKFTLEAWVKYHAPSLSPGGGWALISKGATRDYRWQLIAGGKLQLDTAAWSVPSVSAIPADTWAHVVTTFDGARVRHYINGVEDASVAAVGNPTVTQNPLFIGYYGGSPIFSNETLDEVAVYDHVLPPERIAAHYNQAYYKPPTGTVWFRERDGSAYRLEVVTLTGETPDPAQTEKVLETVIPGGLIWSFRHIEAWDYQAMTDEGGTYAELSVTYGTYSDLREHNQGTGQLPPVPPRLDSVVPNSVTQLTTPTLTFTGNFPDDMTGFTAEIYTLGLSAAHPPLPVTKVSNTECTATGQIASVWDEPEGTIRIMDAGGNAYTNTVPFTITIAI